MDVAWRADRVVRKTGLTTSRRGELRLSDADETLRRRSVERQHDPLSFSYSFTFPAETKTPSPAAAAADDRATVTGPILTVNSVSNPAGDQCTDGATFSVPLVTE